MIRGWERQQVLRSVVLWSTVVGWFKFDGAVYDVLCMGQTKSKFEHSYWNAFEVVSMQHSNRIYQVWYWNKRSHIILHEFIPRTGLGMRRITCCQVEWWHQVVLGVLAIQHVPAVADHAHFWSASCGETVCAETAIR